MKRNEAIYLQHILDAIQRVETYLASVDEHTFMTDSLIQDGVIRQLEIIGEAVKRLPSTIRNMQPHIPWTAIAGMRDKLIHDYFMVDISQVWLTAITDLPPLRVAVAQIANNIASHEET
jgi:uncharacterized protein with HEPN domain